MDFEVGNWELRNGLRIEEWILKLGLELSSELVKPRQSFEMRRI